MPLTLLTGLFGMNVDIPRIWPGGDVRRSGEITVAMFAVSGLMLWVFKKRHWM